MQINNQDKILKGKEIVKCSTIIFFQVCFLSSCFLMPSIFPYNILRIFIWIIALLPYIFRESISNFFKKRN